MSTKSVPERDSSYAAYMSTVFASGARTAAHHAQFIEGRVRVRSALVPLSDEHLREVQSAAEGVFGFSEASYSASSDARRAANSRRPYQVVAFHTSSAARFRADSWAAVKKPELLESRYLRTGELKGAGDAALCAVWNVPLAAIPTLLATASVLRDAARDLLDWIEGAGPGDQVLITFRRVTPGLAGQEDEPPCRGLALDGQGRSSMVPRQERIRTRCLAGTGRETFRQPRRASPLVPRGPRRIGGARGLAHRGCRSPRVAGVSVHQDPAANGIGPVAPRDRANPSPPTP